MRLRPAVAGLLLLLCASTAQAAGTPLQRAGDDAVSALERMDEADFKEALSRMRKALRDAAAPVSPSEAALVHQIEGISASLAFNSRGALASLQAWRFLDPSAALSEEIAFEGSALAQQFRTVEPLGDGRHAAVIVPASTILLVDGLPASSVPAERAAVIQLRATDGTIRYSGYYRGGEALPDGSGLRWPLLDLAPGPPADRQSEQLAQPEPSGAVGKADPTASAPVAAPPVDPPPVPPTRRGPRVPLLIGGGAAALGAVGLYSLSAVTQQQFKTPGMVEDDMQELGQVYYRNHAEVLGAAGLAALGLGLGVGAFLEVSW